MLFRSTLYDTRSRRVSNHIIKNRSQKPECKSLKGKIFDCAFPISNGKSKISLYCSTLFVKLHVDLQSKAMITLTPQAKSGAVEDKAGEGTVEKQSSHRARADVYKRANLSVYSWRERVLIHLADVVFYLLINVIGRTMRFSVEGWENYERATANGSAPIFASWHNRILLSTYFWRGRKIVVMTSQSFDGEYIARFIQRFGYGAARGSSSRGSTGAFVEMRRMARAGVPTGFTVDGPRGPRYVAKTGAVALAKKTGQPILPFTIIARPRWEAGSWDRLQIPMLFARARVRIAPPIFVPPDANNELMEAKREELQRTLNELNGASDA
jgi:lysophospholipid acyltransferase (LPLAT)-like uncharacterized protein